MHEDTSRRRGETRSRGARRRRTRPHAKLDTASEDLGLSAIVGCGFRVRGIDVDAAMDRVVLLERLVVVERQGRLHEQSRCREEEGVLDV